MRRISYPAKDIIPYKGYHNLRRISYPTKDIGKFGTKTYGSQGSNFFFISSSGILDGFSRTIRTSVVPRIECRILKPQQKIYLQPKNSKKYSSDPNLAYPSTRYFLPLTTTCFSPFSIQRNGDAFSRFSNFDAAKLK